MVHELRCWPEPFVALLSGEKTFEFRKDDRGFRVGDVLLLREWRPCEDCEGDGTGNGGETDCGRCEGAAGRSTGRVTRFVVSYILRGAFGVPEGYCVMSVQP